MKKVYALENLDCLKDDNIISIFLAGGTYRDLEKAKQKSWRLEAIKYFEEMNFDGILIIPEFRDFKKLHIRYYSYFT